MQYLGSGSDFVNPNWHHPPAVYMSCGLKSFVSHSSTWDNMLYFSYFCMHACKPTSSDMDTFTPTTSPLLAWVFVLVLLTLSLYFIRAPGPDNSPGLQLDLKCPSLWPLGLLRIKQCQYCAQLQVSVQVVHLRVVVHPRNGSVGKEARGPSHVHFPCLLSVSSQNNLLSPGLDRDTYSRRRGGNPWNNNSPGTSCVSRLYTYHMGVRGCCCQKQILPEHVYLPLDMLSTRFNFFSGFKMFFQLLSFSS